MKRLLLLLVILLPLQVSLGAKSKNTAPADKVSLMINGCRQYKGAEVVTLGRFALFALRSAVRITGTDDPDTKTALALMGGVKSIAVLDFEECSPRDKETIVRNLDRVLKNTEFLMEANDSGSKMRIYGNLDEARNEIKNFVLYAPSDCSVICISGTVPLDSVSKLMSDD